MRARAGRVYAHMYVCVRAHACAVRTGVRSPVRVCVRVCVQAHAAATHRFRDSLWVLQQALRSEGSPHIESPHVPISPQIHLPPFLLPLPTAYRVRLFERDRVKDIVHPIHGVACLTPAPLLPPFFPPTPPCRTRLSSTSAQSNIPQHFDCLPSPSWTPLTPGGVSSKARCSPS